MSNVISPSAFNNPEDQHADGNDWEDMHDYLPGQD
jgi:hypothetical protein